MAIHGTGFLKAAKSEDTISSKTSRRSSILEDGLAASTASTGSSAGDNINENKKLPNLEETPSGKAGNGNHAGSQQPRSNGLKETNTASAELPRLTGTKSQASTASSSATRDSGISVNDVQKAAEEVLNKRTNNANASTAASRRPSKVSLRSRTSSSRSNISNNRAGMISVDDLPIAGRTMTLGRRPGTNKSTVSNFDSGHDSQRSTLGTAASTASRASSKIDGVKKQPPQSLQYSRSISSGSTPSVKQNGYLKNGSNSLQSHGTLSKKAISENSVIHPRRGRNHSEEVTPPRSPLMVESNKQSHILLRPADNSPFTSGAASGLHSLHGLVCNQSNTSTNSTPFSQISVPSSYEYEDDFTSESESEVSLLPAAMLPLGQPPIPHHSYQLPPNLTPTADKR